MARPGSSKRRLLAAVALGLLLAACSRDVVVRGNIPDPEVAAGITPGVTTRQEVAQALGSPSTMSSFESRTWYYIGQKQTQFAFLDPDVLERVVLAVTFDEFGVVQETRTYTLEDGRTVEIVDRETPTEGREMTVLQQLFMNLGRFPTDATISGNQ